MATFFCAVFPYRKLSDSILKEISQFVELAKKQIQQDKKVAELQKKTIDEATQAALDIQTQYRSSSQKYVQSITTETLAGNQAFDQSQLYATLDIPFFTEDARQKFAADITLIFIEDYEWKLSNPTDYDDDSIIAQIRKEIYSLNGTGLSGRIKDLSAFISQRMEQGSQFLNTHIADLNFYTQYVCEQIEGLMTEIEEPWNVLHDCEWAMSDLEGVYAIYQRIQGYRKNAAS